MGFCGCTLQTSAIVAAVFGIIESIGGLIGGIIFAEGLSTYTSRLNYAGYVVKNVMISASVFNSFWLLATIILIIGIVKENAVMHRLWVGVTSVIMVVDLAHTIALIYGFVNFSTYYSSYGYQSNQSSPYYSYYTYGTGVFLLVLLITAVSRGSIWLWVINICLTIYTAHRANEIERGPVQPGTTVLVYGNHPVQPYPMTGQTVIVQNSGPSSGVPPNYSHQQPQYGQPQTQYGQPQTEYGQPQTQYWQPPGNLPAPHPEVPSKH